MICLNGNYCGSGGWEIFNDIENGQFIFDKLEKSRNEVIYVKWYKRVFKTDEKYTFLDFSIQFQL